MQENKQKTIFIGVRLKQSGSNPFAVGSTVKIYSGNQILTRELVPARGFQSSMDYKLEFGLGKQQVDSMLVIWPDRTYESFTSLLSI